MPNVTFYFEVHQPYRLKRVYSFIEDKEFIDVEKNREIFNKVADKWFLDRMCPDSLEAKDIALSRRKPGFKSRSGHSKGGVYDISFLISP